MKKCTKIVATISDKKCDVDFLSQLYNEGMNVVRLNTAHQDKEASLKVMGNVRKVADDIALLLDTKGPEIRTCNIDGGIDVVPGKQLYLVGPDSRIEEGVLSVTYKNIVEDLSEGDVVLIDDGDVELVVISKEADKLLIEATNTGKIRNRKSVNIPGVSVNLPSLTEKDIEYIHFAIKEDIDFIAHSFVRRKEDVIAIQEILDNHSSDIKIIAKIENQEGVDNIDEILDHVYGIMVARGDLAIEIPAEKIPVVQKNIVEKCIESKKPVIIATQMLHSMIEHPRPTRAEITDIANAIYNRTDAIMLSGETAYGKYPIEAVRVMTKVAQEIEKDIKADEQQNLVRINNEITAVLARAAVKATSKLPIKAIVVDTLTGRTGRYLSAFRGNIPVYARCYRKRIVRELALSYGVKSDYVELLDSRDQFIKRSLNDLVRKHYFDMDDEVLVIGGSFGPALGASFMEISKVSALTSKV